MIVVGSRKMVVYDDVADNKIAIFDKGIDRKAVLGENMDFDNPQRAQFNYRSGDIVLPEIKFTEPLRVEAEHFVDCIRTAQTPLTGLRHARNVVSVLERARPVSGEWRTCHHRMTGPTLRSAGIRNVQFGVNVTVSNPLIFTTAPSAITPLLDRSSRFSGV